MTDEVKPIKLDVIETAAPTYLSARVSEDPFEIVALPENIIAALKWAREEYDTEYKKMYVVFHKYKGVSAELLKEVAEVAGSSPIKITVLPLGMQEILISYDNCKQTLFLQPEEAFVWFGDTQRKIRRLAIFFDFHNKPQSTSELDKWIAKAVRKRDRVRPWQCYHHGDIASDGFRVHMDSDLEHVTREGSEIPQSHIDAIREWTTSKSKPCTFGVNAMKKAIKAGMAMNKKTATLDVKRDSIVVTGIKINSEKENKKVGKSRVVVEAENKGGMAEIFVDPQFMLDALSGMNDIASMQIVNKWMITIKSGSRTAVMMLKHPNAK